MPLIEIAEKAAEVASRADARITLDLSNNSAFAQLLAPKLGKDARTACSLPR
jgi:hypothetical protein